MTYPETPLDVLVELYYDGAWHDVTADVLCRTPITIERGRADEAQRVETTTCKLMFNNGQSKVAPTVTGRYSRRNPRSDLYGKIGRGTPVRVSVRAGSTYLLLPGQALDRATTPDASQIDITGSIDVRIQVRLTNWSTAGDAIELAGRYGVSGSLRSWLWLYGANRDLVLRWSADGTNIIQQPSTVTVPVPPSGRIALRSTLDASNSVVTHYWAPTIAGPWTQLGDPSAAGGATSLFNTSLALEVGAVADLGFVSAAGAVEAFELYDGIAGTPAALADFTAQTAGASSFVDDAGLTWTMQNNAALSTTRVRFVGEIDDWPPRWDVSQRDAWMQVEAGGILRRLGQGDGTVLQSVLRREMTADDATLPVAYWPIEDAARAGTVASGLGSTAMEVNGSPEFAAFSGFACSDAIVTVKTGSSLTGRVPRYTSTGETQVRWLCNVPDSGGPTDAVLLRIDTTGSAARWDLVYRTGGALELISYDDAGTQLATTGASGFDVDGRLLRMSLEFTQDGSDIDYEIVTFEVDGEGLVDSFTLASQTFGRVWKVTVAPGANVDGVSYGHLAVYDVITSIFDLQNQTNAWNGERAGRRLERLCAENGIVFTYSGDLDTTEPMGPQRSDTLLNLLDEAAAADVSAIQETRETYGLTFHPRTALYNQTAVAELTYDGEDGPVGVPTEPAEDDQYLKNRLTVSREEGSSFTYAREDGPNSIQPVPDGAGPRGGSVSLNVESDTQLPDQAAWRVALGTVDEPHWPNIPVNLAAAPEIIGEVCELDTGLRMTISDPPEWVPPETIDQLVQGYIETIGHPVDWDTTFNTVPYSPYLVAVRDTSGRRETNGSELALAAGTNDSTLYVSATTSLTDSEETSLWITSDGVAGSDPAEFPIPVQFGGETGSATAIESAGWDTFTRSVSNAWGTADSGQSWTVSGGAASERAVNGSRASVTLASSPSTLRFQTLVAGLADSEVRARFRAGQVSTGASIVPGIILRYQDGSNYYRARLHFATGGALYVSVTRATTQIGTEVLLPYTYTTGDEFEIRVRITGHTVRIKAWPVGGVEPGGWHTEETVSTSTIDTGTVGISCSAFAGNTNVSPVTEFDNFDLISPQAFAVTRAVNGIDKSHAAGTAVTLAKTAPPAVRAL